MGLQENRAELTYWQQWHENYQSPDSSLSRRLAVVRQRIGEALDQRPPGPVRVVSMCAGDGRDLLGVLQNHPRAGDVSGRLVELDSILAERARADAPPGIEIACRDAGLSDAYAGAVPANLLLCCGVFGNVSDEDILNTIHAWPMLCTSGATVIWTRGAFRSGPDLRNDVRQWVGLAGFDEIAFDGPPENYGVGVARMVRTPEPLRRNVHFFTFLSRDT